MTGKVKNALSYTPEISYTAGMYKVFCCVTILLMAVLYGDVQEDLLNRPIAKGTLLSERYIGAIGVMEYSCANGMKVAVKSTLTGGEEGEVLVNLFAKGGWIVCAEDERASAKYAGTIGLESGLEGMGPYQLTQFLTDNGVDLSIRTRQCQRSLEGSCPRESLAAFFKVIHHLFASPAFTREGFAKVMESSKDAVLYRAYDCESLFEDLYYALNTSGDPAFKPRLERELENVDFQKAHKVFEASFTVPRDFTCVVVGPVTFEEVKDLAARYLASIPDKASSNLWACMPPHPTFPTSIQKKTIACGSDEESLTRITFSMVQPLDAHDMQNIEFLSQVIETRLRNVFLDNMDSTYGVDVSYIFPLYPYVSPAYLTVQYRCPEDLQPKLLQRTLLEIGDLQRRGPSLEEIQAVKTLFRRMDRFWSGNDGYWLATISNYYKWGWDPNLIADETTTYGGNTPDSVKEYLKALFSVDVYTVATMVPAR